MLAVSLSGCVSGSADSNARISVIDSLELVGTDSAFVARPSAVAITGDRQILVADNGNMAVWRFDSTGRLLGRVGAPGDGPGGLRSATDIALIGDSLIVVNNMVRRHLEIFSLPEGNYKASIQIPLSVASIRTAGDTVLLGGIDPAGEHSVLEVPMGLGKQVGSGPVPLLLARNPILIGPFGNLLFDIRAGLRASAFEASDWLFFWTERAKADSVAMPKIRRRGARVDLLSAVARDTSKGLAALFKSSVPMYLRFLSDRTVLVVHGDLDFERTLFTGVFFASTVDLVTRRPVCVDMRVPVPSDPLPKFFTAGDTLFAVVQHDQGRTFLVRMRVPNEACHQE